LSKQDEGEGLFEVAAWGHPEGLTSGRRHSEEADVRIKARPFAPHEPAAALAAANSKTGELYKNA